MFENFGDYMFYLLPGPLKKKKGRNQFQIFFSVLGKVFDSLKEAVFKVREETSILMASPEMLDIFAYERDTYRLRGEGLDEYRERLMAKADVAELAGSEQGILLALKTVWKTGCDIEPLWRTDQSRWAEIYVNMYADDIDQQNVDFECIQAEVMKTKQASTFPNYRFYYPTAFLTEETIGLSIVIRVESIFFDNTSFLNGSRLLDGSIKLDAEMTEASAQVKINGIWHKL